MEVELNAGFELSVEYQKWDYDEVCLDDVVRDLFKRYGSGLEITVNLKENKKCIRQ